MIKLTIIELLVFSITVSAWAGTFVEQFDDRNLETWQELIAHNAAPGSWDIIDGELQAISHGGFTRLLITGNEAWRDYVIRFDIKPLKKHGPGNIAIAARVKKNWMVWCVIGDMPFPLPESRATCLGGNFHDDRLFLFDTKPSPFLKLSEWSTLKLSTYGKIVTFSINGKQPLKPIEIPAPKEAQKIHLGFPDLLSGGVGLGLTNYTARFDNVVITGDGIPDTGGLPITPRLTLTTTWGSLKQF